jgi:predicted nucleic acid-binding protein
MERTESHSTILHAGPIIHLDEVGCLDLLCDFGSLITAEIVWHEACRHRPHLQPTDVVGLQVVPVMTLPSPRLAALVDTLGLAAGETAALILAGSYASPMFMTDDSAARLAAESLGLRTHGTLGILVRSIRRGLRSRSEVLGILSALRERSTLHVAPDLLADVITRVGAG